MPKEVGNFLLSVGPMLLIVVAMILMMVLPNRKKQKEIKAMMEAMKKGDYVKTIGGINGRIISIKEDLVIVETGGEHKSQITFTKGAIASVGDSPVEGDPISEEETKHALGGK